MKCRRCGKVITGIVYPAGNNIYIGLCDGVWIVQPYCLECLEETAID